MRFAYTGAGGYVFIVNVAPKENLDRELFMHATNEDGTSARDENGELIVRSLTEAEYRAFATQHTIAGLPQGATDFVVLPDDWAPPDIDYLYRDAWRKNGATIYVDMPVAREIHRGIMRNKRRPTFDALDVAYMKAMESGQDTASVVAQKQALRDVTANPAIEAAKTPGELRAVWPKALA